MRFPHTRSGCCWSRRQWRLRGDRCLGHIEARFKVRLLRIRLGRNNLGGPAVQVLGGTLRDGPRGLKYIRGADAGLVSGCLCGARGSGVAGDRDGYRGQIQFPANVLEGI